MNAKPYALPYVHPAVRDLAFLLTSPSPWRSGADIDPALLLGGDGPERLQALDQRPQALAGWLAQRPCRRLGQYAERLFDYWFQHAPHIEVAARNLIVINRQRRTLGEFDFLLRIDGQPWHLETTSKYYLQLGNNADTLLGPSLRDAWRLKATKLATQLQLSRHDAAQAWLPEGFAGCRVGARLTGWFFYPPDRVPADFTGLAGWYAPLLSPWPQSGEHSRWRWLPRLDWLAPARADETQTLSEDALRQTLLHSDAPQLVAELRRQDDGRWQEAARGFVIPPGWPDESRLQSLMAKVDALAGAGSTP